MNAALTTLLLLVTFIISFLVWPGADIQQNQCADTRPCRENSIQSYGGGLEFIAQKSKSAATSLSETDITYVKNSNRYSLDITQALIGAAVVAVATAATLLGAARVAFRK